MTKYNKPEKIQRTPTRNFIVMKFYDEDFAKDWKTGNLSRFMRNLFEDNEFIRKAYRKYGITTRESFAVRMSSRISNQFNYHKYKYNLNTINVHLLPKGHVNYKDYMMIATRCYPTAHKVIGD